MAKPTKAELAGQHHAAAEDLFAGARQSLSTATDLYAQSEAEHRSEAATHSAQAEAAAANGAQAARVLGRLDDLLS